MWAYLSVLLLSLLSVGLLVHQYHLSENMHLRATTVQLQNEKQQLEKENKKCQNENQQLQMEKQLLHMKNQQLQNEKQQLQKENQQLQKENQHLQDGSTWNKVVFCITTANGIASIVTGVALGALSPTSVYRAAINILYQVLGIDSSTSVPTIGFKNDPAG